MSRIDGDIAVVRHGYRAVNDADLEALTELLHENASWHTPGRSPVAGDAIGRDAVIARFARYVGETSGTFRAHLKRVLMDEDGKVIGIHQSIGARHGRELDVYCCVVFELASGRIVDGREHFYDLHTWDEFWS